MDRAAKNREARTCRRRRRPVEPGAAEPRESPGERPPDSPSSAGADGVSHVASAGAVETIRGRRRPARYGLLVQFESRPADLELARLVDSTVWINDAHPAFLRAAGSRAIGYHTALAVALALAPLAVEPIGEHGFITQFLAHWGGTQARPRRNRRRAGRKRT